MGLWLDWDNFQLAHIYVKIQMFEKISVKKTFKAFKKLTFFCARGKSQVFYTRLAGKDGVSSCLYKARFKFSNAVLCSESQLYML